MAQKIAPKTRCFFSALLTSNNQRHDRHPHIVLLQSMQRFARHFIISRKHIHCQFFRSRSRPIGTHYPNTTFTRSMSLPAYEARQPNLGLASKDEVKKAAQNPDSLFIDVRTKDEVEAAPFACCKFVHHSCSVDSTEGLEEAVKPHIVSYDAPVIVFCRSGRRAVKAKETLEKMGCTQVYNAGGLEDMDYLSKENRSA